MIDTVHAKSPCPLAPAGMRSVRSPPCALVVDDDSLVRMGAVDILEEAVFRVLDADHGDAALGLLEIQHPEIIGRSTEQYLPQSKTYTICAKVDRIIIFTHASAISAHQQAELLYQQLFCYDRVSSLA